MPATKSHLDLASLVRNNHLRRTERHPVVMEDRSIPLSHPSRIAAAGRGYRALRRGRVSLPKHVYFVTVVTVDRRRVFSTPCAARAACQCFSDVDLLGKDRLLAWVLMPDHAHWLLELGEQGALSRSVGRLKSACARHVNAAMGSQGRLWQKGFHDHAIRSDEQLEAAAQYLCANPVRAGLVARIEDYPWWDSAWR